MDSHSLPNMAINPEGSGQIGGSVQIRPMVMILLCLAMGGPASAQPAPAVEAAGAIPPSGNTGVEAGFQAFLGNIAAQARGQGVSAATLDAILPSLTYNPRVVELDRAQPDDSSPSAPPRLSDYLAKRLDPIRISRGRSRLASLAPQISDIEQRYGVPGKIVLAIWGMETNYGSYTGDFDIFRSLATLAYDGRRRALFTKELIAALQIVDRGLARRDMLLGSWAGAMGNPQFLPSSYLKMGVDGNGDGRIDIWNNDLDTLASIANYLSKSGWHRGQPWGMQVYVPRSLDRERVANTFVAPSCPRVFARHSRWITIDEWKSLGLQPLGASWPDGQTLATLVEPDGPGGRAFLTFGNYRALLAYNCSNYYAISVGLLGDAIAH